MKFEEAKKAMVTYLKSEEFKKREDATTTQPGIKILEEINNSGYITTNSQIGTLTKGYNPDTKKYYNIKERAYLEGFMKKQKALAFITYMNTNTDKVAYYLFANPDPLFEKLYFSDVKHVSPRIGVTISGDSKKSLSDIDSFEIYTSLSTVLPKSTFDFYKKITKINKTEDVLWVSVYDPLYGRDAIGKNGLFKVVLDALKHIK